MRQVSFRIALALAAACPLAAGAQDSVVNVDPAVAASNVTAALRGAQDIDTQDISVTTHAGTVMLTGHVRSEAEAQRALAVAEAAAQTARVSNHLEVRPADQAVQQAAVRLVREVEQALQRDARTAQLGVAVSIDEEGVIGLHGLVSSAEGRATAQQVASRVDGVTRVRNHLVLPGD